MLFCIENELVCSKNEKKNVKLATHIVSWWNKFIFDIGGDFYSTFCEFEFPSSIHNMFANLNLLTNWKVQLNRMQMYFIHLFFVERKFSSNNWIFKYKFIRSINSNLFERKKIDEDLQFERLFWNLNWMLFDTSLNAFFDRFTVYMMHAHIHMKINLIDIFNMDKISMLYTMSSIQLKIVCSIFSVTQYL